VVRREARDELRTRGRLRGRRRALVRRPAAGARHRTRESE